MMIKYEWIVVHHSASPLWTTVDDIRNWHLQRGFSDTGYHFVIHNDGTVHRGRSIRHRGAHALGQGNKKGIAICLVGDNTSQEDKWTQKQKEALTSLVEDIEYIIPNLTLFGHKDIAEKPTDCPGVSSGEIRRIVYG